MFEKNMFLAKTNQTMKTSSRPKTDFWELCFATVYGASGKYVTYGAKRWRRLCSNSESVGFPLPGYGFSKSRCRGIATQQKIRSAQCRAGVGFGISHIYFSYIYIYIHVAALRKKTDAHSHCVGGHTCNERFAASISKWPLGEECPGC